MMKKLVKTDTGDVVSEATFRNRNKNSLFSGISEEIANEKGYSVVIDDPKPEHEPIAYAVRDASVEKRGERWYQTYIVVLRGDADSRVRSERDTLLSETDWTQVSDAPVDQAAWAAYRQALRDIPAQDGFPENVTWPTKPE